MASIHKSQFVTEVKYEVDKASLAEVQKSLQSIQNAAIRQTNAGTITPELKAASDAAKELSTILNQSWNTKLNQLDLTKFNASIKASYGSIEQLRTRMIQGGEVGVNAFNNIARSVLSTNVALQKSNQWLDKMAITMSNTIRFGISSSIFNNFTGSIQKAYSYVQKLDKSLNDIRIVSNASAADMEKFAKYANQAAGAMGASTLDYTNAALIYYQQGLDEKQVKERSDITVKMANVLGTNASEVSDYMTAIWNNFDDGSKSLEYYADVLTSLGAKTASSAEEISTGLEKFAAVSSTVGLSYEYAAAALTTVTDRTRQSAEVVGTAFKTLFARIQGLKLGETLEDGTTLNKYSEALQAVGISIKDQSGNLKDMDDILDEMGAKWGTLSKDQQVALAQTVAGVRQYTQLIALMDNWDFFQQNVQWAADATGELNKQQEIYMDSLEATEKQLEAQKQALYSGLLDKDAIISFNKIVIDALKVLNTYITGLGDGLNPIMTLLSHAGSIFSNQIGGALANRTINKSIQKQNAANYIAQQDWAGINISNDTSASGQGYKEELEYYEKIKEVRQQLNEEELVSANNSLTRIGNLKEEIAFAENWKIIANENKTAKDQEITDLEGINQAINTQIELFKQLNTSIAENKITFAEYNAEVDGGRAFDSEKTKNKYLDAFTSIKDGRIELSKEASVEEQREYEKTTQLLFQIGNKIKEGQVLSEEEVNILLKEQNKQLEQTKDKLYNLRGAAKGYKDLQEGVVSDKQKQLKAEEAVILKLEEEKRLAKEYSDLVRGVSWIVSSFTSLKGIFNVLQDDTLTGWQKFSAILSVVSVQITMMIKNWTSLKNFLPALVNTLQRITGSVKDNIIKLGTAVMASRAFKKAKKEEAQANLEAAKAIDKNTASLNKNTAAKKLNQSVGNGNGSGAISQIPTSALTGGGLSATGAKVATGATTSAASTAAAGGTSATTAAMSATGAATTGAATSTMTLGSAMAALAPYILAVVAVVGILVGAYMLLTKEQRARQKEIEKEQEAIDRTTKALENVRQGYEDVKNTIDSYGSLREKIDSLKTGTLEWYDAIAKANEEAQKLIERWNLVAGQDYTLGAGGQIQIKDDVMEQKQYEEYQKVLLADAQRQDAQLVRTRRETQEAQDKIIENFQKDVNKQAREQGSKSYISQAQAREILENQFNQNPTNIGNVKNSPLTIPGSINSVLDAIQGNADQISTEGHQDSIDITKSIAKWGSQYQINEMKLRSAQYQATETRFRGTASKDQLKQYENLTSFGQEAANAIQTKMYKRARANAEEVIEERKANRSVLQKFGEWAMGLDYMYENGKNAWEKDFDVKANAEIFGRIDNIEENLKNSGYNLNNTQQSYLTSAILARQAGTLKNEDIQTLSKTELDYLRTQSLMDSNVLPQLSKVGSKSDQKDKEALQYSLNSNGMIDIDAYMQNRHNTSLKEYKEFQETYDGGMLSHMYDDEIAAIEKYNEQQKLINEQYQQLEAQGEERTTERKALDLKAYNAELETQAAELETTKDALDLYGKALIRSQGEVAQETQEEAAMIAQHAKFNKAYNQSVKVYDDNKEAFDEYTKSLKEGKEVSLETAEGAAAVMQALKDVDLNNIKLDPESEDFEDTLKNINKLLSGTESEAQAAYEALNKMSISNTLADRLGYTKEQADAAAEAIKNIKPGEELTGLASKAADDLAEYVNTHQMAAEDIIRLYADAGLQISEQDLSPKTDYTIHENEFTDAAQSTHHRYDGDMVLSNGETKEVHYEWIETVEPKTTKWYTVNKDANVTTNSKKRNFKLSPSNAQKTKTGSSSKPKKVEHKDVEIDRYHKIDKQIEKVDKTLEKLQKDQDRLTGKSKFDNLTKQWQLLNQQAQNYNEKIKIAQGEQKELRDSLAKQGVTFNADGTVKNYVEIIRQKDAHLKSLQDQYNKLSAKQQEKWDEQKILQNAEEELSKLQKDLDRYDDLTVNVIPDLQMDKLETDIQKLEDRIQQLNLEVDVKLKTAETERDWNAFRKRVIDKVKDDDILGNMRVTAADMATYISNNNSGQLDVDNAHLRYLLDHQNEFAADPVKYQEELDKAYKQVQDDLLAIQDLEEEMHQYNLDMLDEAQDKFNKQIDTYQQLGDMLEHDAKLVEMTLGDKAYEQLGQLFEKQHENNTQQLIFYRTQVDYWKQIRDGYKEGSDEWNNANEKMIEAMNNAESTLETVLQNTAEVFKNSINQMFKVFNDGLTKGFGLDYANEQWDLINKNADTYLDTINQIQGINDLERKYLDAINKNSNPTAQQKLQKIMSEQLTLLREKDRLTKSDLDMAQKRYDLYVAQIALEEAQRNKSTMYLRRDSRGNYRYQYAMDTEAYDKAKNDVDIARNALYNENKARAISDIENIQKTNEEMQQKLQKAMENNDLDMIALLDEQYTQWLGENRTEFAQHLAELDEAIAEEWLAKTGEDFTTASAERQAEIRRQLIPQLEALSRYSVDGLTSDSLAQLFAQAREMVNANKNTINEDLANGGRTLEELQEGKNKDIEIVTELLDKNQDLLDNYKEQIDATNDFVEAEIARVEALKAERDMVENATEAYEKLTNARNKEGADYAKALGLDTYSNTYGQEGMNTHDYEAAIEELKVLQNQALEEIAKAVYGSAAQEYIDLIKNNNSLSSNAITAGQVLRFASGGYTGDWAGTSRLAALDQKELILNATDTANMLNAVTVMRNLAYSLGETTLARLAGVAANSPGFKTDENGIVQDVHIDAQFPNVTNSREIEEAFNNLVNAASQRIFTNK